MRARRTFIERADDWREKYLALQDSHIATELELQAANAERDEAKAEVAKLRAENAALLAQMRLAGASRVTSIPKKNSGVGPFREFNDGGGEVASECGVSPVIGLLEP